MVDQLLAARDVALEVTAWHLAPALVALPHFAKVVVICEQMLRVYTRSCARVEKLDFETGLETY